MKKNVLITGASGNVGKAAVEKFLSAGFHPILTYSSNKKFNYSKDDVSIYQADLTVEKSVNETIEKIIIDHKNIDAAILTVGGFSIGSIETTDEAALQKMFTINFNTAYFVARPIFKHMMAQGKGRIIFIGSRPALVPSEGKNTVAYSLSKSLIFKLAELLNEEAKGNDVVASVIVPSTIDTPSNRAAMPTSNFGDWVTVDEITDAMLFLTSDQSSALRDPVFKLYSNS